MKNVAICGSTCVGKTTLLNALKHRFLPQALIVAENVEQNPYVCSADAGEKSKALHSQIFFYNSYLKSIAELLKNEDNENRIVLFDRFIEDHLLISTYRHKIGELGDDDFDVCSGLAHSICSLPLKIDKVIYLYCSESTMIERLSIRDKSWDRSQNYDNIRLLSRMYDCWYEKISARYPSIKVNTDIPIDFNAVIDFIISE